MKTPPTDLAPRPEKKRPRFTFAIPESARLSPDDPRKVTLVPVTLAEELMAQKAAEASKSPVGYELAKMSIIAVDGKPLDWASGARETFLETVSAPVRQLVMAAYVRVNNPAPEAEKDFLASMLTEV